MGMTLNRTVELLKIERECVSRQDCDQDCGHDCGKCDLAQDTDELLAAYDEAISRLKAYHSFCRWLRRQCFDGMNDELSKEIALRKLHGLGYVQKDGDTWGYNDGQAE